MSVESVMPSNHLLPIPNYLGSFSSYFNDPRDINKLPEATLPVAELDLLLCLPYTEPPSAALCSTWDTQWLVKQPSWTSENKKGRAFATRAQRSSMSRKAVRLSEERMPRNGKLMGLPGGHGIRRCVPSTGGLVQSLVWATARGIAKSRTGLSNWACTRTRGTETPLVAATEPGWSRAGCHSEDPVPQNEAQHSLSRH